MNYINKLSYFYSDLPSRQLRIVSDIPQTTLDCDLPSRQLRMDLDYMRHRNKGDLPYRQLKIKTIDSMFKLM